MIGNREIPAARVDEPSAFDYLCSHRVFSVLSQQALRELSLAALTRTYRKGQHLFYAGDAQTYVFIVRSGLVALTDLDDGGNARVVLTYDVGDVFGPPAIVLGQRHAFTATAVIDTRLCLIGKEAFDHLYRTNPALAHKIIGELQAMLRRSQMLTIRMARASVPERLAAFLLRFSEKSAETDGPTTAFELPLSRGDLAFLLCTTRETVIRALARLSRSGLITIDGRSICIRERGALQRLAEV